VPSWLNNVAIVVEHAHRDLGDNLAALLKSYHIVISPTPAAADYLLIIERDDTTEEIASVSSSTTARQYQLTYKVCFKLIKKNGEEIIPSTHVMVTREVTINNNRILGSNQEEALLKSEMRRDAATQILSRINRNRFIKEHLK